MRLGKWTTVRELGSGGQGTAYLALDTDRLNLDALVGETRQLIIQLHAVATPEANQRNAYRLLARSIVSQDLSVQVPSVAPNQPGYGGIGGTATVNGMIPSTFSAGPGQTNAPGIFTDPTEPDPGAPAGVNGPAAPATPSDANEGVGVAGVGSAGGGAAGAASAPSDAGGGVSGAYKKGGRVRGHRPDPRMLAAKLRQGAKVDVGDPRAKGDNVKRVDLQTGEEVMNRPAARAHAAQLEAWNRTGRRAMGQGGMAVGTPRDQRR
jgi:hypothetical protein